MRLADKGLNPQAEAIEEAQTEIRLIVRDGWLNRMSKAQINMLVQKAIARALKVVTNENLRSAAVRSLNAFAERQYSAYLRQFGVSPILLLLLGVLAENKPNTPQFERAAEIIRDSGIIGTEARGVALQEYSKDYFEKRVKPVLDRLADENGIDPDDVSGRNSLRNRAEMEVRYERHLEEIGSLRASGVKLVVSSVHADCSDRCYEWQGRVYSLDGTSGTTEDGKHYVPLEKATDVYYTTKAGKTYKNGLLGFNCRHYLMPYKTNMVIPFVDKATQQKESAINTRQRELEREVQHWRVQALMHKGVPGERQEYLAARRKAIDTNREYIQFSKDNGRAYYPSRVKLL